MNNFQIIAQGKILDTYDDVAISLNYQIEDILDITKRNSSYSKTIKIPGTPTNNKFFKRIFQVDIDQAFFNPNVKIDSTLRIGDNIIMTGSLQLVDIIKNNKLVEYEIVVTGVLKNILFDFGDLSLRNLDLSEYNHTRSKTNIQNSWTYQVKSFGNTINVGEPGRGYVYPYIINGNSSDVLTRAYCYDMYPAVYVKTIIDKIFDYAGYTYTSNFFNSPDYFKKLILPYIYDKLEKSEEQISDQTMVAGISGTGTSSISTWESTPILFNQWFQGEYQFPTGYRNLSPVMQRGYGWYKNNTKNYYIGFSRESGTVGDKEFKDVLGQFSNNDSVGGGSVFTCNYAGYFDINFNGNVIMKYRSKILAGTIQHTSGNLKYYGRLWKKKANGAMSILSQSSSIPTFFTPSPGSHATPWYDTANPLPFNFTASNVFLEVGDKLYIEFALEYNKDVKWVGVSDNILVQALLPESLGGIPTYLEVKPSSNNDMSVDTQINMNNVLPDIKIKDFFLNIVKMFNLVVADNPNKPNDLIIEPRDDYYASKTKVEDWTKKIDNDSDIIITPMSELDARIYHYKYSYDDDYYNKQYKDEINKEYGESIFEVLNDFSQETNKLELMFSPTPDAQLYIGDRVAPFFVDINDNTMSPRQVNTRILFYGGLLSTNKTYILKDYPQQDNSLGVSLTKYPYCGMWDNPTSPVYDLAFDRTAKVYYNTTQYPFNNLMEKFHKQTFKNITDPNSRMMEAMFYLTPKDIATFDFRNIILIDNVYWRVNKILDYNPIGNDTLTKVILLKLNDLKIFAPDSVGVPTSNGACPVDVVRKKSGTQIVYASASGQVLNQDCCKQLGGIWSGGRCLVQRIWARPVDTESAQTKPTGGGINAEAFMMGAISEKVNSNLQKEQISPNSPNVKTTGRQVYIGEGVRNANVIGDNTSVVTDKKNVLIVGDNITASEDGVIYLEKLKITNEGIQNTAVYVIDGGLNEVMKVNKTNLIDLLDGGINSVRNFGGDSKLRPIIDGSLPVFGTVDKIE